MGGGVVVWVGVGVWWYGYGKRAVTTVRNYCASMLCVSFLFIFIYLLFMFDAHLLGARRTLRLPPPMERRACHVRRREDPVCNGGRVRAELEK